VLGGKKKGMLLFSNPDPKSLFKPGEERGEGGRNTRRAGALRRPGPRMRTDREITKGGGGGANRSGRTLLTFSEQEGEGERGLNLKKGRKRLFLHYLRRLKRNNHTLLTNKGNGRKKKALLERRSPGCPCQKGRGERHAGFDLLNILITWLVERIFSFSIRY